MGLSINSGTPSHHLFSKRIFPDINQPFLGTPMTMENLHMGLSINRGTPSHHLFSKRIFPDKNQPFLGTPMTMETSISTLDVESQPKSATQQRHGSSLPRLGGLWRGSNDDAGGWTWLALEEVDEGPGGRHWTLARTPRWNRRLWKMGHWNSWFRLI